MEPRRVFVAVFAGLLLATFAFGRLVGRGGGDEVTTVTVERGTLEVMVVQMGTLVAPRSVTIASEIQSNRAKVVQLAPEGSVVRKGDLLVSFDPAPFLEDQTKFTRGRKEAEANLQQVQQDASLQKVKNEQLAQDAAARLRMATLEVETLEKGGAPLSVKESAARVEQTKQQRTQAIQAFADSQAFLKEGFITRKEYEDSLARYGDTGRAYDLAVAEYQNLVQYRQPADRERARSQLARAKADVERVTETASHEELRAQALLTKAEMAAESARADLAKAEAELEKAKILSPADGFLVYNELPIGSEYRKIQIGDSVWQGQPILTLPDTSEMAVETWVREFDLDKVHPGQPAVVRLQAFRGMTLAGKVDFIGNLATKREPNRRDKNFSLRVLLEETRPELRPGMTAEVEIGVDRATDVLLLPIQAVVARDGRTHCTVVERGRLVEREIRVGKSNTDSIVVLSGLEEGESVSLHPGQGRSWLAGR